MTSTPDSRDQSTEDFHNFVERRTQYAVEQLRIVEYVLNEGEERLFAGLSAIVSTVLEQLDPLVDQVVSEDVMATEAAARRAEEGAQS
jgi:hypothetical protein